MACCDPASSELKASLLDLRFALSYPLSQASTKEASKIFSTFLFNIYLGF